MEIVSIIPIDNTRGDSKHYSYRQSIKCVQVVLTSLVGYKDMVLYWEEYRPPISTLAVLMNHHFPSVFFSSHL